MAVLMPPRATDGGCPLLPRRTSVETRLPTNVFVLEDEVVLQQLIVEALEQRGLTVHASHLWSDIARELITSPRARPTVLVSDLSLPGIRGEDFCRTMLRHEPDLRIVLFTAEDAGVATAVAQSLGASVRLVFKTEGVERLCEVLDDLAALEPRGEGDA
jgi:CheY-like chemotaxis protein